MRLLVSPQFSVKLAALRPVDIQRVGAVVRIIESSEKAQLLSQVSLLGDGVYVWKLGPSRLYFTLGSDSEGDYVLLLDATTEQVNISKGQLFATKDPRANSSLNPALNSSINPTFNSSLNPQFNSSINPTFNSSLNPQFNSSINPTFNSSLNPQFNSSINPRFNSSLNPLFNSSINPRVNSAFGGPFLYSGGLRQEGYLVRANEKVELLFDLSGNHLGELVRVNDNVRVQFDTNNQWNGYLVRANDDVALRYSVEGEWIGLVV